jgi:serine/threonine-protein kinase
MGLVFEAVHVHTGRCVAVKLLTEQGAERETMRERLRREARALGVVRHPNVVEVLDAAISERWGPWIALEMLEGRVLEGILAARRRLAPVDVVHVGRQICDALTFAHARGVLHRDVKPSNLFVAWDPLGRELVKIIDFGIAWAPGPSTDARLTQANELLGTPAYMAPEQMLGRDLDARTDVYGVGATLFECLTGTTPYTGPYPQVLVAVSAPSPPPSVRAIAADVPATLAAVIEKAIAKEPADRFADVASFARTLVNAIGQPEHFGAHPSRRGDHTLALLDGRPMAAVPAVLSVARAPSGPGAGEGGGAVAQQRRKYARNAYVTAALLLMNDGTIAEGRTEDLSEGGVLVLTSTACTVGTRVRVRFALPMGKLLAVDGTVRWTRAANDKVVLGIEFVETSGETRAAIAKALRASSKPS